MIHTFRTSVIIPCHVFDVFAFFSKAANLERITPHALCFRILTQAPIKMGPGTHIEFHLRLHGIPFRWSTLIALWDPPHRFVDVQKRGPYKRWIHMHCFSEHKKGTKMVDEVIYGLPFWPVGEILYPFVHHEISRIFLFRKKAILEIFNKEISTQNQKETNDGIKSDVRF